MASPFALIFSLCTISRSITQPEDGNTSTRGTTTEFTLGWEGCNLLKYILILAT